ncbi:MliC family protein [Pseudomonas borbori]
MGKVIKVAKSLMMCALPVLLAGCASQPPAQWTRWVCDSGAQVFWRFTDSEMERVDVRLGEKGAVHHLKQEPSGSGELYGDGRLSFHTKGEQGLVYWTATDDLIGRGCTAQ